MKKLLLIFMIQFIAQTYAAEIKCFSTVNKVSDIYKLPDIEKQSYPEVVDGIFLFNSVLKVSESLNAYLSVHSLNGKHSVMARLQNDSVSQPKVLGSSTKQIISTQETVEVSLEVTNTDYMQSLIDQLGEKSTQFQLERAYFSKDVVKSIEISCRLKNVTID